VRPERIEAWSILRVCAYSPARSASAAPLKLHGTPPDDPDLHRPGPARAFSVLAWAARKHHIKDRSCNPSADANQSEHAGKAGRRRSYAIGDNQSDGIGNKIIWGRYPPSRWCRRKPVQLLAIEILGSHRRLRPDRCGNRQHGHKGGLSQETGHQHSPSVRGHHSITYPLLRSALTIYSFYFDRF